MEDILRQILSEIKDLKSGQQRLEHSHESLCIEVSSLKDGQESLRSEVSSLKDGQESLRSEVSFLKNGQTVILQRLDSIEGQQRENTDFIKALLHNQEASNAAMEGHILNTATRKQVDRLEAKINNLNSRFFDQEAEITLLKAVK